MKKSKYVGREYSGWKVSHIYLAANYSHSTRHNAYRYTLERITSDAKCYKKITVSAVTMMKIDKGLVNIEALADKKGKSKTNYEFI